MASMVPGVERPRGRRGAPTAIRPRSRSPKSRAGASVISCTAAFEGTSWRPRMQSPRNRVGYGEPSIRSRWAPASEPPSSTSALLPERPTQRPSRPRCRSAVAARARSSGRRWPRCRRAWRTRRRPCSAAMSRDQASLVLLVLGREHVADQVVGRTRPSRASGGPVGVAHHLRPGPPDPSGGGSARRRGRRARRASPGGATGRRR